MRITLLSVGSRGDVQPLLGFGLGPGARPATTCASPRFPASSSR